MNTSLQVGTWTWRHWEIDVVLPAGRHSMAVRAADSAGAEQPADLREAWNVKSYGNNARHRIGITAE